MKLEKLAGATSEIWQIFVRDSSSTTGGGLTGLVFNTASLTAYYHRDTDTTATAITLVTMTVGTFTSSGFKEIDATNMPGWYQFCPPNAAIASGAKSCAIHLKGATNMAPLPIEVQLTSYDPDNATSLGLSRLDAAVTTRMATYTQPTGFLTATFPAGTVASTTNITAGTITTASNLTTNNDKTGYSLVAGYDLAKTAAQAGDAMTLTAAYNAAKTASQAGDAMALTGGERTTLAGVINTTAIVESYRANGAAPTPAQFMSEVLAHLGESSISGTTKSTHKFDHATTAQTYTLDSGTIPTSITRAT